jgi:hypothetical protein
MIKWESQKKRATLAKILLSHVIDVQASHQAETDYLITIVHKDPVSVDIERFCKLWIKI